MEEEVPRIWPDEMRKVRNERREGFNCFRSSMFMTGLTLKILPPQVMSLTFSCYNHLIEQKQLFTFAYPELQL
jgi:hypothetical protein